MFVNVPQSYANNIKAGAKAGLRVRNFPDHEFEGVITLTAGAVDPNTRTLRVQIDFLNADGKLFAGEYGEVRLPVTEQVPVSLIPSSALIFNAAGLTVGTIGPDDKVVVKTVALGRDFGTELEVTSGLTTADHVTHQPRRADRQRDRGDRARAADGGHHSPPRRRPPPQAARRHPPGDRLGRVTTTQCIV